MISSTRPWKLDISLPILLGVLWVAASGFASAQTLTSWESTSDGSWNNSSNWSLNTVPTNANNANFNTLGYTAVDLGTGGTAQQITFTGAAQAYTFSGGTLLLDLNSSSTSPTSQFNVIDNGTETGAATQTFNNLVEIENSASTAIYAAINVESGTTLDLYGGLKFVPGSGSKDILAFSSGSTSASTVNIGGTSDFGTGGADIQFTGRAGAIYNLTGTITAGDTGTLDLRPATNSSETLNLSNSSIGNMVLNEGSGSNTGFRVLTTNFVGQNLSFGTSNAITIDWYDSSNTATTVGVGAYVADYTGTGTSVDTVAGTVTISPLVFYTDNALNAAANNTLDITGVVGTKYNMATGTNSNLLINGTATAAGVVSGSGTGTVIFGSAGNTYSTPTIVAGGTFLANSTTTTSTGTSTVQVGVSGSTATLGGIGLIAPTTKTASTINITGTGILAPGGSGGIALASTYGSPTGTLTIKAPTSAAADFLNFASGAKLSFNLNSGVTNSQLSLTSAFTSEVAFNNNVINFTDLSSGGLSAGIYNLITDDNTSNADYTGLTLSGSTITGGLSIGTGFSAYSGTYSESLSLTGGNIQLDVTAVPEPGTWAMMLGGVVLLFLVTFRRRSHVRA
jgi:hypothetical protein